MSLHINKIMYVSHRYHTNQVPIMEGWFKNGVDVLFMAQYQGAIESIKYVHYHKMKPSSITKLRYKYIDSKYDKVAAENKKNLVFLPHITDTLKTIKQFNPDVVILREYTLGNSIIYMLCKIAGIKRVVMYNQIPLYDYQSNRGRISSLVGSILFPHCCFSPVLYYGNNRSMSTMNKVWYAPHYFVPLVATAPPSLGKEYYKDGRVNVLVVGKYREYKNHFFLVDAFSKVVNKNSYKVTVIGQLSNEVEINYYNKLKNYIKELGLSNYIECLGDVSFDKMPAIYSSNDVLILPSKRESAGMVILEAMAQGLCVMGGNCCGLSSYLDNFDCGFVFSVEDTNELTEQLNYISDHQEVIKEKGNKAYHVVKEHFSFENYKSSLDLLLNKEFGG